MSQGDVGATEGFLGRAEMWSDTGAAVLWEWGRMGWSDFGFHGGGCDEGVACSGGGGGEGGMIAQWMWICSAELRWACTGGRHGCGRTPLEGGWSPGG